MFVIITDHLGVAMSILYSTDVGTVQSLKNIWGDSVLIFLINSLMVLNMVFSVCKGVFKCMYIYCKHCSETYLIS